MATPKHTAIHPHDLQRLPAAVLSHAFSFLPPNERTLTARFICREAAAALSNTEAFTASLSQPLPAHAVPWAVEAGQQHIPQLPFEHKLQLLSTAAASGSEVNLEVALALLQPSIFPEMLVCGHGMWCQSEVFPDPDPSWAAISAGHTHLLGWLLRRCPALMCPELTLEAAAVHCDLAGLQGVWRVLNGEEQPVNWGGRPRPALDQSTLNAAARSLTPDAVAKMQWVLGTAEQGRCRLDNAAVEDAARSGDLNRLRWLWEQGCRLNGPESCVLEESLEHADMSVVQWLVDEAGCELQGPPLAYDYYLHRLVAAAAKGPDGPARVLWLQERGVVLRDRIGKLLRHLEEPGLEFTAEQAQTLQYVMQRHSDDLSAEQRAQLERGLRIAAVLSGSIPLVEELQQSRIVFDYRAYYDAVRTRRCDIEMIRWLVTEARVSTRGLSLRELFEPSWLRGTPARRRELLKAVQLLVGAGAGAGSRDVQEAMYWAAVEGNLPVVQSLAQHIEQQLGCQPDWHRAMGAAVESGCGALLEWLAGKAGCLAD